MTKNAKFDNVCRQLEVVIFNEGMICNASYANNIYQSMTINYTAI